MDIKQRKGGTEDEYEVGRTMQWEDQSEADQEIDFGNTRSSWHDGYQQEQIQFWERLKVLTGPEWCWFQVIQNKAVQLMNEIVVSFMAS